MLNRPIVRLPALLILLTLAALAGSLAQPRTAATRSALAGALPAPLTLPLVHRFVVGLPTDDVAVLPVSRTLLLAQEAGRRALAIDEGTGRLEGTIALPTGARHVAADPALGQIYLPDEFSGRLVVARMAGGWDHLVTQTVAVGRQPHGVAVDPRTHRVYVGNEHGATVSVVDGRSLQVRATVPVGQTPGGVAAAPASGLVYVVLVAENRVAVLDTRADRVVRYVAVGAGPTHVALDARTERAAVVNTAAGTLSVVDGRRGSAAAPVPAGDAPYGVAVDGQNGFIFASSAHKPTVTIVESASLRVRGTVRLDMVPGAVSVDPTRRLLIVAGASRPWVEVFSYRGLSQHGPAAPTVGSMTSGRRAPAWWTNPAAIARGAYDVATGSCISCHPLAGISNAGAAIDLTHEGRRRSLGWLMHELAHPTSPRPPIPPGQLRDIAAYLLSLR